MRHIAWLHSKASEGKNEESRYKKISNHDPDDFRLVVPDCTAQYLLNIGVSIGLSKSTGFGMTTMSPMDIKAYSEVFKYEFEIWEAETLMRMSNVYVSAYNEFDGVDCLPPASQDLQRDRDEVASKLLQSLVRRSQANKRSAPIGGRQK